MVCPCAVVFGILIPKVFFTIEQPKQKQASLWIWLQIKKTSGL